MLYKDMATDKSLKGFYYFDIKYIIISLYTY